MSDSAYRHRRGPDRRLCLAHVPPSLVRDLLVETGMTRIVIDPGHGGTHLDGKSTPFGEFLRGGLYEKDVTLDIARHAAARLGGHATLTRTNDLNLSLAQRADVAARNGADVFVSIHASSGRRGPQAWIHTDASPSSEALASSLDHALSRVSGRYGGSGTARGPMAVLSPHVLGPHVAACMLEIDGDATSYGGGRLSDADHRAALGAGIAHALDNHVLARLGERPSPNPYIIPSPTDYSGQGLSAFFRVWANWFGRWSRWRFGIPHSAYSHFPHSAICELEVSGAGGTGFGTGFFIGPSKILTCGHNFKSGSFTANQVTVKPGHSPVQSIFPEKTFSVNWRDVVHPNWRASEDDDFDLAVLNTPGLSAPNNQYFSLPNMSPSANEQVVVCGYGKFQSDGVADSDEGQYLDGGTITNATAEQYHFPIQAIPGHSGSPMFWNEMVVGVLTGPRMITTTTISDHENRAVRLTPDKNDWIRRR